MTFTATPDDGTASIQLNLSWSGGPAQATVYRVDTGNTATPVRNGEPATLSTGSWIGVDYEAPFDEALTYRAVDTTNNTNIMTTAPVTLDSLDQTWLRHPARPTLSQIIDVQSMDTQTRSIAQGVFQIKARRNPIVVSGRRRAATTTLTVNTETAEQEQAMLDLLDDGSTLLLSTPDGYGWGSQYVSIGDVDAARNSPIGTVATRIWTLPLTITDRPIGLTAAGVGNSWADVETHYATWRLVEDTKATWRDLLTSVT